MSRPRPNALAWLGLSAVLLVIDQLDQVGWPSRAWSTSSR